MKIAFCVLLLLTAPWPVMAQLNNRPFEQRQPINPADSNALLFGINALGFTRNNEYFNDIADGYTLFGYQLNPYFSYYPASNFRIDAGVYLRKDFGANGYAKIAPTFSLKYLHDDVTIIFGNLEGSVSHRLIEPLYDFERVMVDRLESGVQLLIDNEKLFLDGWVDWQHMIYKGDPAQEEVTGGLSVKYRFMDAEHLELSVPVQFLVKHKGGQIDSSPAPLQTYTNSAVGISALFRCGDGNYIQTIGMDNYYVHHKDFSNERLQAFADGSGWYFNLSVKTRSDLQLMTSYWRGHEFISIMGGQLYPSVSGTFKNPWAIEEVRELFILRFMHNLKITDQLYLSTRIEPFYDIKNSSFEFSHGFYITYATDFFLLKKQDNR